MNQDWDLADPVNLTYRLSPLSVCNNYNNIRWNYGLINSVLS